MATRYVSASVLTVAFAAIAAFCAVILIPQGANAALVSVEACDGGTIALNAYENRVRKFTTRPANSGG